MRFLLLLTLGAGASLVGCTGEQLETSSTTGAADGGSTAAATTTSRSFERENEGSKGGSGGAPELPGSFEREGSKGGGGSAPELPNILLIIADDIGAESVSLYPELVGDSGAVPIPNLEALAAHGLVFDNAWASPVCSPTRATIVSGQYGHRTGVTYVNAVLPADTVTVFDRLTAESPSYGQAFFGKYHLGGKDPTSAQHVADIGVPTFRGMLGGSIHNYYEWVEYSLDEPPSTNTTYSTTAFTDFAIDYIREREATRPNDPWFVYQAYNAAHTPYQVPPAELHSVDLGGARPGRVSSKLPTYKAIIQSLDTSIGRLLAEVDLEETTVIFIGDNGTPAAHKDTGSGVRGSKAGVYEGGLRVPLIVAGAGVTRRGREDALVSSVDLYATVLALAGLPVSHVNDSYSVKPLLSDETATSGRTHSFSEMAAADLATQRYAIRDSRYKLIFSNRRWQMYDLIEDPLETTNLYKSVAHQAARAALEAEIALLAPNAPDGYFH